MVWPLSFYLNLHSNPYNSPYARQGGELQGNSPGTRAERPIRFPGDSMGSADQITQSGSGRAATDAARAAALRRRLRELGGNAGVAAGAAAATAATRKASDTDQDVTADPDDCRFAELAQRVNRTRTGAIPALPASATGASQRIARKRWRSCAPTIRECGTDIDRGGFPARYLLGLAPVWLISAVFHVILIVVLALLTYHYPQLRSTILIAGDSREPETVPDTLDDFTFGIAETEFEQPLWSPEKVDVSGLSVELPAVTAAPDFSVDWAGLDTRSEQLSAVQTVKGSILPRRNKEGSGAQFYGIQASGDRFVFIVDSSTSMRLKFADAKRELECAVRGLNQDQLFYVIFFDRDAERLRLGKWNERRTRYSLKSRPELDLVPANEDNINGLVYWMNTIQLDNDTNPYPAVVYALRKLRPDAVFLLSDGEFNDGGATEAFLTRENIVDDPTNGPTPKTIVHCVGFYSRKGEITLQRIAEDNGGTYRFVEPPRGLLPFLGRFPAAPSPVR